MAGRTLTREELKAAILWCARMWLSYTDEPFPGPINVRIAKPDEAEAMFVKPRATTDGMVAPSWFALGEPGALGVSVSELLGVFLSPDERRLLADLAKHQPCSATAVQERTRPTIRKSAFWELWGNLQQRGLVVQGDDERYRLGPGWLKAVVEEKPEEGRPAA